MKYIYAGKIVNTHGIKGEVKVLSDLKEKKEVFNGDVILYVKDTNEELIIKTVRYHKDCILLTFEGINDINEVLKYKNKEIYIERKDFENIKYFDEELIDFEVYLDNKIGQVDAIRKGIKYDFLVVGKNLIPNIKEFVKEIDVESKKIYIHNWEGLIDEN